MKCLKCLFKFLKFKMSALNVPQRFACIMFLQNFFDVVDQFDIMWSTISYRRIVGSHCLKNCTSS